MQLLPEDVPLHFIDPNLRILVTDKDFVIDKSGAGAGDTSCNEIGDVVIEDDDESILKYEVRSGDDDSSEIFLMFNQRIDGISFSSDFYSIRLTVKVS